MEITQERVQLALRWVVLFTGFTAADDYQPTASRGLSMDLTEEVTRMCVAFHPIAQIHRLPQDSPVFLFWQAHSTREWVITRISLAPNPQGLRTALEYCSLVLDHEEFREFRFNPFRTRSLNLHDRIRRHHLADKITPLDYAMAKATTPPTTIVPANAHSEFPTLSAERVSDDANVGAIQEFCSRWSADPIPPPSFATWWASKGSAPEGYFDIVLHAPEPKALTLHEARTAITQLCADLKASLPSPESSDLTAVDLVRSLLSDAADAEDTVTHAAAYVHSESAESLQAQLTETALKINRLRAALSCLLTRLEGSLADEDVFQLQSLAGRSQEIEQGMQSIRHPNPFRRVSVGATVTTASSDGKGATHWIANQVPQATQTQQALAPQPLGVTAAPKKKRSFFSYFSFLGGGSQA